MAGQSRVGPSRRRRSRRDSGEPHLAVASVYDALQGAYETLGFVIEAVSDGIAVVGHDGALIFANPSLRSLVGSPSECIHGLPFESLFPGAVRRSLRAQLRHWASEPGRGDVPLDPGRGGGRVLSLTGRPLRTERFSGVLVLVADVSEVRMRERQAAILAEADHELLAAGTLREGCILLLRTLGQAVGRPAGALVILDGGIGRTATAYRWRSEAAPLGSLVDSTVLGEIEGLVAEVLATGASRHAAAAAETTPAFATLVEDQASVQAFPLLHAGAPVGVVELLGPQPPGPDRLLDAVMATVSTSMGAYVASRVAEDHLRRVFEVSPVGMALVDAVGRVLRANPVFTAIMGRGIDGPEEVWLTQLVHEDDRPGLLALWAELRGGLRNSFDLEALGRSGSGRSWVRLTASTGDRQDVPGHLVLVAEDVTARHESQRAVGAALAAKSAALARANRLGEIMTRSISVVSHEFRTGLFGMQGYSEILQREELPSTTVRKYAEIINGDAKRMGRLINDLLDLNRMEIGREQLQCEQVDLAAVVGEAIDRARMASARHRLVSEIADGLPPVVADPDRLTQVMGNLLNNAIKYSPEGGEVHVRLRAAEGTVAIDVTDEGIGIPRSMLDEVFEPFTRSEDRRALGIKGTGLGLPIVRHIVRMHGGRVWAESRVGGGTVFHVELPLLPPSSGDAMGPSAGVDEIVHGTGVDGS